MKSRICPYRGHCHSAGDCENCDFGKALEKLNNKIKRLKAVNEKLYAENKELKDRIEIITFPDF